MPWRCKSKGGAIQCQDLKVLNTKKHLDALPGIGAAFASKIQEYINTGKIAEFEQLKTLVPPGLLDILNIPGLGPKKVKLFYTQLGITNLEQLAKAVKEGQIEQLPRMGKKSADKILEAINRFHLQPKRFLLGDAIPQIESIIEDLKSSKLIDRISYAGSARRQNVTVGDIDIICSTNNPAQVIAYFKKQPYINEIIAEGNTKISVYLQSKLQMDLRVVAPHQFGAALQYFTGSKAHNVKLRTIAKTLGYKINEYGIFKENQCVGGENEEDIYKTLKMRTPPPEIRENTGEIELAQTQNLPHLINLKNIRGDLHMHSTYSDGKQSIREMTEAAQARGYEYIAITDHSPSLHIAKGVSESALVEKKAEIDKLNNDPDIKIKILFGTEVDILADGTLDYPNKILKTFDIVIASIHSRLSQDNTQRIISAMQNPFVHIIGHPGTRMLNKRDQSPNDWSKIFTVAAQTNTILEINASPKRLDLDGNLVKEAQKYGCTFTINTDAHNIDQLDFMCYGVGQARRGYLTKADVINTYSLKQLLTKLKQSINCKA